MFMDISHSILRYDYDFKKKETEPSNTTDYVLQTLEHFCLKRNPRD